MEALVTLIHPNGTLLTYSQEETRKVNGRTISISPVWKWLLGREWEG